MMTTKPFVSFIIPFFNAGATIQETIDSIFNQSYPNYDIWIVNDGSTDPQSLEKLKAIENHDRITIIHQENAGPGSARNLAAKHSLADYLVFLDADDIILPNTLEFLINEVKDSDDVLYGNCVYFGSKNGIKKQEQSSQLNILVANPIALCCLIRATAFQKVRFDTHLDKKGLEDWELFISMFALNMNFRYIDTPPLFKIRVSENSRTYQVANANLENVKTYVSQKHHSFIYESYVRLHRELKIQKTSIEQKIGFIIMKPYRILKKIIKK